MFHRKSDQENEVETVIALHSQQYTMSYIPPVYLRNGPNQKRQCTNLGCCFLFMLSMAALGYFYFEAYISEHIEKLYIPIDPNGRLCGQDDLNKFPLIYFANPDPNYLYQTVCVSSCPTSNTKLDCAPNKIVTSCNQNINPKDPSKQILIYNSTSFANNICLPVDENYKQSVQSAIMVGDIQQAVISIMRSMPIIVMSAGIALGIALILTVLLRFLTTFMTWAFLLVYISMTSFLSVYFFLYFAGKPLQFFQLPDLQTGSRDLTWNWYMMFFGVVFGLMALNALFNVCWNFTKMKFMINLIKLATLFLFRNLTVFIVPILFFFLILGSIAIWVTSSIFIISLDRVNIDHSQPIMPFPRLNLSVGLISKLMIALLGLIWLRQYILSYARFITVSTATLWYFYSDIDKHQNQYLTPSFKMALRYHNGSIIAEAIYTVFFSWMASIFNSFYETLQKYRLKRHSPFLHYSASCLLCLCCCCESFIMYINSYAFVQIVLTSQNYFEASQAVFFTIKRNSDFDTLSGLGDSFTHYSKIFIFLSATIFSFFYMAKLPDYEQIITHPLYALAMMAYVTLSIATLFMDMFGQSADALILVYFTDCEVEKFHFGREECASCPEAIRETLRHIREKQKTYYG